MVIHASVLMRPPRWLRDLLPAAVALVAALAAAGCADGRPAASREPAAASDADARGSGVTRAAVLRRGDDYVRWELPSAEGLFMIPSAKRYGDIWTGDMRTSQLVRLDPSSGRYTSYTFPSATAPQPMGVAVADDTSVWLAYQGTHAIARFDYETREYEVYPTPTPGSAPFSLARDGQGRIWFTEMAARQIGVFDPARRAFVEYRLPLDERHPYWLAVAPDGRIWFTVIDAPLLGVLDPTSGEVRLLPIPGVGDQDGTTGISIARDGTVWFGVLSGRLGRLDPESGAITTWQSPGATAYGVAAAGTGLVWLAVTEETIYAFDPATEAFCPIETGDGARWLSEGEDGSIWVVEGRKETNAIGQVSPKRAARPCG